MRLCLAPIVAIMLVACGRQPQTATLATSSGTTASRSTAAAASRIPPVELGKRPPGTPMTSANMPFFDIVTYCEVTTRKADITPRGPAYENCAGNQTHYRSIIGEAIDARQFKEPKVVECAKASHAAYEGMWYCMNDQPYS